MAANNEQNQHLNSKIIFNLNNNFILYLEEKEYDKLNFIVNEVASTIKNYEPILYEDTYMLSPDIHPWQYIKIIIIACHLIILGELDIVFKINPYTIFKILENKSLTNVRNNSDDVIRVEIEKNSWNNLVNEPKGIYTDGTIKLDFDYIVLYALSKGRLSPVFKYGLIAIKEFNSLNEQLQLSYLCHTKSMTQNVSHEHEKLQKIYLTLSILNNTINSIKEGYITYEKYLWYETILAEGEADTIINTMETMRKFVWANEFIHYNSLNNSRLKNLLFPLLGSDNEELRVLAQGIVTHLIDTHNWQFSIPLFPNIEMLGNKLKIQISLFLPINPYQEAECSDKYYLALYAPVSITGEEHNYSTVTFHKLVWKSVKDCAISDKYISIKRGSKTNYKWTAELELGNFQKCGFYDYRLFYYSDELCRFVTVTNPVNENPYGRGSSYLLASFDGNTGELYFDNETTVFKILSRLVNDSNGTVPVQGRIIVHPNNIQNANLSEVQIDYYEAELSDNGNFITRGSFSKIANSISKIKKNDINGLFLNCVMARDNGNINHDSQFERPNVSPYAIVCRSIPAAILGGDQGFKQITAEKNKNNIRIYIDAPIRISAKNYHRKYKNTILYYLNESNIQLRVVGSIGPAYNYNETVQLNYRDPSVFDMYIEDIISWIKTYEIDGIKIDNAIHIPTYHKIDKKEMVRRDVDLAMHYSYSDILRGKIVLHAKDKDYINHGIYSTDLIQKHYSNPLLVYIAKELWRHKPDLAIFGDCGILEADTIDRIGCLARSGIIPYLTNTPKILGPILGYSINKSGDITEASKVDVSTLYDWHKETHTNLPSNALLIQTSCLPNSALPALLYGPAIWSAISYLFLATDIPCTMLDEEKGLSIRFNTCHYYYSEDLYEDYNEQAHRCLLCSCGNNNTSNPAFAKGAKDLSSLMEAQIIEKHLNEQIYQKSGRDPDKIVEFYNKCREIRNRYSIFREGTIIPLIAYDRQGNILKSVYAYCRVTNQPNLVLCAINFSDIAIHDVCISLNFFKSFIHSCNLSPTTVCELWNMAKFNNNYNNTSATVECLLSNNIDPLVSGVLALMILPQFLSLQHILYLPAYGSVQIGMKFIDSMENEEHFKTALYISAIRHANELKIRARNEIDLYNNVVSKNLKIAIFTNYILGNIVQVCADPTSLNELLNIIRNIVEADTLCHEISAMKGKHTNHFDLYDIMVTCEVFKNEPDKAVLFFAKLEKLKQLINEYQVHEDASNQYEQTNYKLDKTSDTVNESKSADLSCPTSQPSTEQSTNLKTIFSLMNKYITKLLERQYIGHLVFITPEFGKFCTVGGLGVMVDDLTYTLVNYHGFEVTVLMPYYHYNRKGETNYLEEFGIHWNKDITVNIGAECLHFGVYEGYDKNVRLLFLHNEEFFSTAYQINSTANQVRFLSAMGKAFLELLCQYNLIPNIIITNDWPTGFTPAYAKCGHFGSVFSNTKFIHIVHNLDSAYEGRVYTTPHEKYQEIHGLPLEAVIDPYWNDVIINPSRAGILYSDNWATVSSRYRDELLGLHENFTPSPLVFILKLTKQPFATCNGIPVELRKKELAQLNMTREQAKIAMQKKYFNMPEGDLTIPIYSFIGRITEQKGVLMILECCEQMINYHQGKIQILIGGRVNWNDPYSARCGELMHGLREKYPNSVYAEPKLFFTDGRLVNLGSDYALMPSLFEPGGIVQHEFFIAGTPVIAYATGGLACTVFEYNYTTEKGNGFVFSKYNHGDFIYAWEKSFKLFKQPYHTQVIRRNAINSVISCEECASKWAEEFHRLTKRIFCTPRKVNVAFKLMKNVSQNISEMMSNSTPMNIKINEVINMRRQNYSNRICCMIEYRSLEKSDNVYLTGSFDNWRNHRKLKYNAETGAHEVIVSVAPGNYQFKFIVDGVWTYSNDYKIVVNNDGIVNNEITV